MKLHVGQAKEHDVYRDVVRIPEGHRVDFRGRRVKEGSICWVSVGDRSTLAWVRGAKWTDPKMTLDELLRRRLKLEIGCEVDVVLKKTTIVGEIQWGLQASEAAYRVATMLAILSVVLGAISLTVALGGLGVIVTVLLAVAVFLLHYWTWLPRNTKA